MQEQYNKDDNIHNIENIKLDHRLKKKLTLIKEDKESRSKKF